MSAKEKRIYVLGTKRGWWSGSDVWSPSIDEAVMFPNYESALRQAQVMNLSTYQIKAK